MTYTATLFDCPVSDADKDEATELFCAAIEAALGGEAAVVAAYRAYNCAFEARGELPLPSVATDAERAAVTRWEDAECAGQRAAFAGWNGNHRGAHFEVSVE